MPRRRLAAVAARGAVVVLALSALPGCAHRGRTPPPGWNSGDPIVTGDVELDERIAHDRALAALDDDAVATLRRSVEASVNHRTDLDDLVRHLLARGAEDEALDVLLEWTRAAGYHDDAMASFLDLALGSEHYAECITSGEEFLDHHEEHPYLMLVVGLCLDRFGRRAAADDLYLQALGLFETLGGMSGVLERELGFDTGERMPDPRARLNDQLRLKELMGGVNVLGHVLMRHVGRLSVDDAPPDPRLVDLGGVRKADVDAVFSSRREVFRLCQLIHGTRRKQPGGRLVVDLVIRRDGSPGRVERTRDTFEVSEVPACLEEQIGNLWFPAPRYGRAIMYQREFRMVGD